MENVDKCKDGNSFDTKHTHQPTTDYTKIRALITAGIHSQEYSPVLAKLRSPQSIAINPETNDIYVCDSSCNKVFVIDESFKFLYSFGQNMHGPYGICISCHKAYITQSEPPSLEIFSTEGNHLNSVGKRGDKELEFETPSGVAVSKKLNRIYLCEEDNHRVQCLNLDLTFNSIIPNVYCAQDIKLGEEEIFVITLYQDNCIRIYDYCHILKREIIPGLNNAFHFCLDKECNTNIILTDLASDCVLIYSKSGELLYKFGKIGNDVGEFTLPTGIVLDCKTE